MKAYFKNSDLKRGYVGTRSIGPGTTCVPQKIVRTVKIVKL